MKKEGVLMFKWSLVVGNVAYFILICKIAIKEVVKILVPTRLSNYDGTFVVYRQNPLEVGISLIALCLIAGNIYFLLASQKGEDLISLWIKRKTAEEKRKIKELERKETV
jgi:hypothetical protein